MCVGCVADSAATDGAVAFMLTGAPVALATQMASAATEERPILIDDICFQAVKTSYTFEAVRAVLLPGGCGPAGISHQMLFALEAASLNKSGKAKRPRRLSIEVPRP